MKNNNKVSAALEAILTKVADDATIEEVQEALRGPASPFGVLCFHMASHLVACPKSAWPSKEELAEQVVNPRSCLHVPTRCERHADAAAALLLSDGKKLLHESAVLNLEHEDLANMMDVLEVLEYGSFCGLFTQAAYARAMGEGMAGSQASFAVVTAMLDMVEAWDAISDLFSTQASTEPRDPFTTQFVADA